MKKGMALEQVAYAIIALVILVVVATMFYRSGQGIWSTVETAFSSESRCLKSGEVVSTYKSDIAVLESTLSKESKDSSAYREAQEKLGALYDEYHQCGFSETLSLSPVAKLALVGYYAAKGNTAAAIALYEEYLAQNKVTPDILNGLSDLYKLSGNDLKSLATLRRIVAENPDTKDAASAQYRVGRYYEKKKDYTKAKEEYQKLLNGNYFSELAEYAIAEITFNNEKPAPYPSTLSGEQEKEVDTIYNRARASEKAEKYEEAIVHYRLLTSRYPTARQGVYAQYEIGHIYRQKKELDRAVVEFTRTPHYGSYGALAALELAQTKIDLKGIKKPI